MLWNLCYFGTWLYSVLRAGLPFPFLRKTGILYRWNLTFSYQSDFRSMVIAGWISHRGCLEIQVQEWIAQRHFFQPSKSTFWRNLMVCLCQKMPFYRVKRCFNLTKNNHSGPLSMQNSWKWVGRLYPRKILICSYSFKKVAWKTISTSLALSLDLRRFWCSLSILGLV